jgi:hypothetical protein
LLRFSSFNSQRKVQLGKPYEIVNYQWPQEKGKYQLAMHELDLLLAVPGALEAFTAALLPFL